MSNPLTSAGDRQAIGGARAERTIRVSPVPGGWRVDSALCGQALMFLSGACAERQARALAARLADAGYDARVEIRDRGDNLAGSIRYARRRAAEVQERASGAWRPTRH